MDTLPPLIQAHMTEIYLVYGMAFLFLAAAIYLQPKDNSVLPFSTILVWLARFGMLHGIRELQCAWELIDGSLNEKNSLVGNLLSFASFYALFEFSRRFWLVLACNSENNRRRLKYIRLFPVVSLLIAGITAALSQNYAAIFDSGIRYLLGFPGAASAGIAFLVYEYRNRPYLSTLKLNFAMLLAGYSLAFYSLFTGLVVNAPWFATPSLADARIFSETTGIPIEALRTLCALALATATGIMLYRVNVEKHRREFQASAQLADLNARLETTIAARTAQLERANEKLQQEVEERRHIEESLRQSQENLNRAQSVAHIGSWYLNQADNGLEWSPETYRIFGVPPGMPLTYEEFLERVHEEDRAFVDRAWQTALKGAEYNIEHRALIDGKVKWLRERAELEFDRQRKMIGAVGTVQDITELKQAELALQQSFEDLSRAEQKQRELRIVAEAEQGRMAALLSAMSIGILFEDKAGSIEYVNLAFRRMWAIEDDLDPVGQSTQFVLENSTHRFARPDHASKYVLKVLDTHEISERFELDLYDGRILTQVSYPVTDTEGRILGRLWIYEDITHERQTAQQLLYLAEHDALTGLYNRHRFQEQLDHMIAMARRNHDKFALIYFDLDEFKYINDNFGHRAGDTVLVRIAGEISVVLREVEIFARLGGDEFAILSYLHPQNDISVLPNRINQAVASIPFRFRGTNIRLTTSVGLAFFPEHGETVEDLVAHADTAMYQAKANGKNTWAVYDPKRDDSGAAMERMSWRQRIEQALRQDLLELHFQGIYRVDNGQLCHFEVLVRMRDPQHPEQLVMPGQFIPIAENSGQILEIDRWVLRSSIALLSENSILPSLAVNISGRSFDDPELPQFIRACLEENRVDANRLIIELTETAAVSDIRDAQRFIEGIRQAGCTVCLDDFGSGFSTFAYLKYLEVDILKIDGMFIRDLPNNRENQIFVKAMVGIAKGMHKTVLAEFVEDAATLQMLKELGIDLAQGYHLGRPSADYGKFIENRAT
ncbi:sensor domain-containing protein [Methylotuvimicrobium alcaliphilum]|uniref:Diguanylate cyclase n=1 Tax=Methylotuvimicrobium alcaliphilum (strain DSM 19304 / NCIMB 14124 / VKM B-2133 / 20Z) TaxID=1091494 RepID=G4SZ12_META2|nr:EAL domain-containing protein [Methylotuvimicrobium alcaliphilum]CCE25469.1 putative Diguanylate cyclase [Methylotuvimicrobium alcaliphilum 20Z]